MAREISREKLDVFEIRFDDGGVGILLEDGGAVHMGYDGADVIRLLSEVFEGTDGDLWIAAERYLDSGSIPANKD